jgi:secreted trypsin-like serine protease
MFVCTLSFAGTSACNGDSGGGMVFKLNTLWYLRGLVSLAKSMDGVCDPAHYIVFTDIAKFLPWLGKNLV